MVNQKVSKFILEWIETAMTWDKLKSVEQLVDMGFCADLASVIYSQFHQDTKVLFRNCGDPCHTWVEIEGLHYDMQNPHGIENWKNMKYFKDCPNAVMEAEA